MASTDMKSLLLAAAGGVAVGALLMKLSKKAPSGFLGKVEEATAAVGQDNLLSPKSAKAFLDANPGCLYLDVQDPGSPSVPGTHKASLGTLIFKASTDLADFKDPKIADLPKGHPILVTCALGGQAKVGAKLLVDYGFTNVKVVEGGCVAWKKEMPYPIEAVCEVSPQGKPCGGGNDTSICTGTITLKQTSAEECSISYEIRGLTPGKHGFHIHEKADFSDGCNSAGPHYNPFKKTHGAPSDEERHVGDLGNIEPGPDGIARGTIVDKLVKLSGETSVIGRSFMVHADEDDLGLGDNSQPGPPPVNGKASKTTGNAGARIACGVINLVRQD
uniref:Superoxide dismutase [Cu-Zn] n=1 Tax=Alexandrium monilatum TaxID=311494 RepID=A0A7S4VYF7_9DINO